MQQPVSEGTPDDPGPRALATDSGGVALKRPYLLKAIVVVALVALLGVAACSGASSPGGDGGSGDGGQGEQ